MQVQQVMGCDPDVIHLPLTADVFTTLQRKSLQFHIVLADFLDQIDLTLHCHKLFTSLQAIPLKSIGIISETP